MARKFEDQLRNELAELIRKVVEVRRIHKASQKRHSAMVAR